MPDLQKTPYTYRNIARFTIELTAPLHIGSGLPNEVSDATVTTDANGFPTIPGSSLAGVLRATIKKRYGANGREAEIFGDLLNSKTSGNNQDADRSSALNLSWGCIHNSANQPVEGLQDPDANLDEVLTLSKLPTLRDHVCINNKGVARDRGKFDELAVHAGHRFTFEMELFEESEETSASMWQDVREALLSGSLRIGGKTRRGFGAFKIVTYRQRTFNLKDSADNKAYREHSPAMATLPADDWEEVNVSTTATASCEPFDTLRLRPRSLWMFGGGVDLEDHHSGVALAPVRDSQVVWENDQGTVRGDVIYIPGSAVKGALSHRVAYHYNLLEKNFADGKDMESGSLEDFTGDNNVAVKALFGAIKDNKGGIRGKVMINDVFLSRDMPSQRVPHVKIDSFTGGAYPSALFDERPLLALPEGMSHIEIPIYLEEQPDGENIMEALKLAIEDIRNGSLALGGGANRGLGVFESADAPSAA